MVSGGLKWTFLFKKKSIYFFLLGLAHHLCEQTYLFAGDSQSSQRPALKWGAFLDTYYAYDFNEPSQFERAYTTQPVRTNEFNLNLGYIEASLDSEQVRGRFALQYGTSVLANSSSEPDIGNYSGVALAQTIQEAVIGYRLTDRLWIDAGIYFSHLGWESFISSRNWTYSRSLAADFSPYFQSGVRLAYEFSPKISAQLHLVNGWQSISNRNSKKGIGVQVSYQIASDWKAIYNNILTDVNGTRVFHDFGLEHDFSDYLQGAVSFDLGQQKIAQAQNFSSWYALTVLGRYRFTPQLSLGLRAEKYLDSHQANVTTGTPHGFNVWGASVNLDVALTSYLLWRSEARRLASADAIFPEHSSVQQDDTFIVESLTLNF
jgi:hypothetical protein